MQKKIIIFLVILAVVQSLMLMDILIGTRFRPQSSSAQYVGSNDWRLREWCGKWYCRTYMHNVRTDETYTIGVYFR